jgi:hypothetical protein
MVRCCVGNLQMFGQVQRSGQGLRVVGVKSRHQQEASVEKSRGVVMLAKPDRFMSRGVAAQKKKKK